MQNFFKNTTPRQYVPVGALLCIYERHDLEIDAGAEDERVKEEHRCRDDPERDFLFCAGGEVIDVVLSGLDHMRDKHISPEEADHAEDVDDRADDQEAL